MQPADRTLLAIAAVCLMVPVLFTHLTKRNPRLYSRQDRKEMFAIGAGAFTLAIVFITLVLL